MAWNRVDLGKFAPDVADYNVGVARMAKNVVPIPGGYKSVRDIEEINNVAASLSAYHHAKGFYFQRTDLSTILTGDGVDLFFLTNNSNLPKFYIDNSGAPSSFEKTSLASSSGPFWQIAPVQWNDDLYIFGDVSPPQKISQSDLIGLNQTSDAPGSPPEAEYAAVVRQQMVVGNTYESAVNYPRRVRWSAFGNPESWTNGTDQAGQEDLLGGGRITGVVGGEFGLIFQETKITRINYIGVPNIWEFDPISEGKGCLSPNSIVKVAEDTYFWAGDGFSVIRNGSVVEPISVGRVNEYIRNSVALNSQDDGFWQQSVHGAYDQGHNHIWWSIPTALQTSTRGEADTILVYDIGSGDWSIIEPTFAANVRMIGLYSRRAGFAGGTLDDRILPSTGLIAYKSTATNTVYTYSFESTDVLAAELETGEIFTEGQESYVRAARPLCDAAMSVQLLTKDNLDDTETEGSVVAQNTHGVCDFDSESKYHRIRLVGGTTDDFDKCAGVMVDWEPAGEY